MDPDLRRTFAAQHGLVTAAQALASGMTRRRIEARIGAGDWEVVHRGVYRIAGAPRSAEQTRLAAVLAVGRGAVVSHRAAVAAWGADGFRSDLVELAVPGGGGQVRRPGVLVHRCRDLATSGTTTLDGLPITTPARTLLHVADVVAPRIVGRWMEQWLSSRRLTVTDLRRDLERVGTVGRRGPAAIRALLDDRVLGDQAADSPAEVLLAEVLRRHGLPLPVHHHLVTVASGRVFELDFAYVDERVYLEFDGYGAHLVSRERFDDDRDRQNELTIEGWRALRFGGRVLRRSPQRVADQVARMLEVAWAGEP